MRHVGYKCSSNTATFPRQFELLRPSLAFDRASGQGASRLQRQFFHVNGSGNIHYFGSASNSEVLAGASGNEQRQQYLLGGNDYLEGGADNDQNGTLIGGIALANFADVITGSAHADVIAGGERSITTNSIARYAVSTCSKHSKRYKNTRISANQAVAVQTISQIGR